MSTKRHWCRLFSGWKIFQLSRDIIQPEHLSIRNPLKAVRKSKRNGVI